MLGRRMQGFLDSDRFLYFRTSMGEDVTEWIEDSDNEYDDDTTDSEEEWHQIKNQDIAGDNAEPEAQNKYL